MRLFFFFVKRFCENARCERRCISSSHWAWPLCAWHGADLHQWMLGRCVVVVVALVVLVVRQKSFYHLQMHRHCELTPALAHVIPGHHQMTSIWSKSLVLNCLTCSAPSSLSLISRFSFNVTLFWWFNKVRQTLSVTLLFFSICNLTAFEHSQQPLRTN